MDVPLGLGGFLKGIGNLVELVRKMEQEGQTHVERSGKFRAGEMDGVYGVRVRVGLGDQIEVSRFGNVAESQEGLTIRKDREPLVDVLPEGDALVVAMELPGAEPSSVQVQVEGDVLSIRASGEDRTYAKELLLPFPVAPEPEQTFTNGVLRLRFKKAPGKAGVG